MKLDQVCFREGHWDKPLPKGLNAEQTICLVFFGNGADFDGPLAQLRAVFDKSTIIGCSGAGEIRGNQLFDETLIVTIAHFEETSFSAFSTDIIEGQNSFFAGETLGRNFSSHDLTSVFILSEGLLVNGTELMNGLRSVLPEKTIISGGLAGDGTRFKSTKILFRDQCRSGQIAAIGFYGKNISVASDSRGGWIPFGPERAITRSEGNTLISIDGRPALTLYKEFLGKSAENLPSSALNFPLFIQDSSSDSSQGIVRTILAVDEKKKTMTFAGDIPEGKTARFMRSTYTSLVEAAKDCAISCKKNITPEQPILSIVVSCIGRRLVMGSITEDEIESVFRHLPQNSVQTGFYSYGELAPGASGFCDLHNQTMTVTWICERKSSA